MILRSTQPSSVRDSIISLSGDIFSSPLSINTSANLHSHPARSQHKEASRHKNRIEGDIMPIDRRNTGGSSRVMILKREKAIMGMEMILMLL
ncbi:hypothetical protein RYX36_011406 [Vicia faba]